MLPTFKHKYSVYHRSLQVFPVVVHLLSPCLFVFGNSFFSCLTEELKLLLMFLSYIQLKSRVMVSDIKINCEKLCQMAISFLLGKS